MKTITYDDAVWKLVPIEPTEKMIVEGFESEPNDYFTDQNELERYKALSGCRQAAYRASKCWSAMLRAVPTSPEVEQARPVVNQQLTTEPSAQDQRDAERYRWLRDRNDWHAEPNLDEEDGTIWKLTFYTPAPIIDPSDDDNLDTALIAAMLADAAHAAKGADND